MRRFVRQEGVEVVGDHHIGGTRDGRSYSDGDRSHRGEQGNKTGPKTQGSETKSPEFVRAWAALSNTDFSAFRRKAYRIFGKSDEAMATALSILLVGLSKQEVWELDWLKNTYFPDDFDMRCVYCQVRKQVFVALKNLADETKVTVGHLITAKASRWVMED